MKSLLTTVLLYSPHSIYTFIGKTDLRPTSYFRIKRQCSPEGTFFFFIRDWKADLNFSEFGAYSIRKQQSKLLSIANSVTDGSMPLWSYTLIHGGAKLSRDDKNLLSGWAKATKDSHSLKK